jgi:hypothetical protein
VHFGEDTVEEDLGSSEASSLGAAVAGIIDAITTDGPADSARLSFLRAIGDDVAKVGCFAAFWDIGRTNEVDRVGAGSIFVALSETADFFGAGFFPKVSFRAGDESRVLDRFASIGMDGFEGSLGGRRRCEKIEDGLHEFGAVGREGDRWMEPLGGRLERSEFAKKGLGDGECGRCRGDEGVERGLFGGILGEGTETVGAIARATRGLVSRGLASRATSRGARAKRRRRRMISLSLLGLGLAALGLGDRCPDIGDGV